MDVREVARHNSQESCWLILFDRVYDGTDFLNDHPGGAALLMKCAGADATEEFSKVHARSMVEETLSAEQCLGDIDLSTKQYMQTRIPVSKASSAIQRSAIPDLSLCVQLEDFEAVAKKVLPQQAYTYLSSAADTLQSHLDNRAQWSKITFVPRVLRDVSKIDLSTSIFGQKCLLPFFVVATGLAGLTHPDGEGALARAAALSGIHYSPSTYASVPHDRIAAIYGNTKPQNSSLFWQLYVNKSRDTTVKLIQHAKQLGFKALIVTVDTPCVGKRDEDKRLRTKKQIELGFVPKKLTLQTTEPQAKQKKVGPGQDNGGLCDSLQWSDLVWIREAWQGPIALKGIQSAEDAKIAADAGVECIYLSNHGGRQLHSAPSSLATLLRIRRKYPEVLQKCEILVDGGLMRGGDILKALCLGARAVGVGRPLLYAMAPYGVDGVLHAIDILKKELETTLALLGATHVDELNASLVNVRNLAREIDGEDGHFLGKL